MQLYWAARVDEIRYPSRVSIAEYFQVHPNTIDHWRAKHPAFRRAIERGLEDRGALRFERFINRRVVWDRGGKPNYKAKTFKGVYPKARVVRVEYDDDTIEAFARTFHARKRDRPDVVKATTYAASDAISKGALTTRAIARQLGMSEAVLRDWRRKHAELDEAILQAIDEYHERQAAHEELWSPGGFARKTARNRGRAALGVIRE